MHARQLDFTVAIGLITLCSATVWAEEPPKSEPEKVAAVATDSPVTPTPADVAREVVRLQEEMGGSITRHLAEPPLSSPPLPRPLPQLPSTWRPLPESPVTVLRETAWQLDQAAHRLEVLDLYDQADALRETAAVLRGDARVMKVGNAKANTAAANPKQ